MDNNSFVKIEDKKMPSYNFKDIDLDSNFDNKSFLNSKSGFTNIVFLSGIIATFIMWVMIMIVGK